jgi:CIC family chloride channel protein
MKSDANPTCSCDELFLAENSRTAFKKEESRIGLLTLISVLIGFAAGFIAFALYNLIGFLTNVLYYQRLVTTFVSPDLNKLGLVAIIIPIIGGVIAGLMIKYGSTRIVGHGIPESMESVLLSRSKIAPKVGILKALSAAFTIGSGQPFGAEGPIIQTGGAFGSFVGQIIRMTGSERKILLAAGAAAGMAATFGTPISAILLVIELLLFEFRVKSLVPVGVASAIGALMHFLLISSTPLFFSPQFSSSAYSFGGNSFSTLELLPFFAALGLISGVMGSALSRGLYKSEDLFRRIPLKQPWLPALGGLIVGIIGYGVPQVLGVGYDIITDILSGQLNLLTIGPVGSLGGGLLVLLLVIMAAKAGAWTLSMGSQTSGGTLAPLFLVGSAMGYAFGTGIISIFPFLQNMGISPGIFALAAMGAVFGTASRAPFASILFVLEVTQAYQGLIPITLTVIIAELVGEYLMEDSIMTEKLSRRGLRVRNIYEYNPLRQIRVSQLMSKPLATVNADQDVISIMKSLSQPNEELWEKKRLAVIKDDKLVGVIDRDEVYKGASIADKELTVGKICSRKYLTINEDESGYEALNTMIMNDVPFLFVVNKEGSPVGYLSRGDLIRAQKHKVEDERIMEKGIHKDVSSDSNTQ